jgi:hypothetical protein
LTTLLGLRGKVFALSAFLLLVAGWPLVHIALVRTIKINPWKLAGWAMYSVPAPSASGSLVVDLPGGKLQFDLGDRAGLPPPSRAAARKFLVHVKDLGLLADPADLAGQFLLFYRDARAIRLNVATKRFQPAEARFSVERVGYECRPVERGQVQCQFFKGSPS